MSKSLNLKIAGLWPAPNDYTTPPGALDVADNCAIDNTDLLNSRRGFSSILASAGGTGAVKSLITTTPYDPSNYGSLITCRAINGSLTSLLFNDSDVYNGITQFTIPPGAVKPHMMNWGAYVYITSTFGLIRAGISDQFASPVSVVGGIPQALDLTLSISGSSGFLTTNSVGTITATTTNTSPTLSGISNIDIALAFAGQLVTGTAIPAATTVLSSSISAPVVIYPGTSITAGSTSMTVTANTGIAVGQIVSGIGIQTNTRVTVISGTTITISIAAIETNASAVITFSSDNTITMSANATGNHTAESVSLSNGSQIAYRLVWGYLNANNATMLGAPSSFTAIANTTGGSCNIQAIATIPAGITTANFYQLYRSIATPTSSIIPPDQMQLVSQGNPSGTDITNGYITITDTTPDSLKGESLYTGTDVEGITQANYRPPVSVDLASFKGYSLFPNFTLPYQLQLDMDGVGSPNGVQTGDTVTIALSATTFTLTADSSENTSTGHFQVFSSGTPAQNIANTTDSFIRVLNRYASNTLCYAYLISGPLDLPGQMLLEGRAGIGAFTAIASAHGSAWTPNLTTSQAATADNEQNAMLISKVNEPEAVPRANLFRAGPFGNQILRVVPLRDYVVILTTAGVYRLTGSSLQDFQLTPFDLTVELIAPESAAALGNECWCLSTQGIVSISDGGVRIRSGLQLNSTIQSLLQSIPTKIFQEGFGLGYEANQKYILALPSTNNDLLCTQQYTYNYITDRWTRWTRTCSAGYASQYNGLFLGSSSAGIAWERRSGTSADYCDEDIAVTIVSSSGASVVLSSVSGINVGDLLTQGAGSAVILAIDTGSKTLTTGDTLGGWANGAATIKTAISNIIQWKPVSSGDPTEAKQYSEGQLIFRFADFVYMTANFSSDISPGFAPVTLTGNSAGSWGSFSWGSEIWGGGDGGPTTLRFYVPASKQYAGVIVPKLNIRQAQSGWQLEGMSLSVYDIGPELGSESNG